MVDELLITLREFTYSSVSGGLAQSTTCVLCQHVNAGSNPVQCCQVMYDNDTNVSETTFKMDNIEFEPNPEWEEFAYWFMEQMEKKEARKKKQKSK